MQRLDIKPDDLKPGDAIVYTNKYYRKGANKDTPKYQAKYSLPERSGI